MSKKVLGIGLSLVAFAIPIVGPAIGLSVLAATLITVGVAVASNFLLGPSKPKGLKTSPSDRLFATLDPTTPRKIVFGDTAMATDVRYQAFTGSDQEYLEQIIVVASHEVHSIDEIWLDNEKAWTSGGGAQGRYVGYLTVTARTLGTNANGIAIDSNWTTSCTLTGCAYVHMKYKTTGNSKTAESPFSGGITSRMTIRGKGAKVYDPRLDSTVTGGSGSHRANDQTTWAWDADASRNPALQELFYELGWKIGGHLAVGKGVPPSRLGLASYGVAANVCDESVSLSGGGTEKRYRSDGVISEGDSPGSVRDTLCATMNGVLRDASGKLALTAIKNDLGSPVTPSGKSAFSDDDVLGEIRWDQTPDLSNTFNIVRGRRVDPSDAALYQLTEYPAASATSTDGIDRIDTFDLPMVQSNGQAQRLAKLRLQRNQYQGRLQFTGGPAFWALSLGDPFALTHSAFGWTAKLFRCAGHSMNRGGAVQIVAVEENTAIYSWSAEETAAIGAGTPVVFNPLNNPIVGGIDDAGTTANWSLVVNDDGTIPADNASSVLMPVSIGSQAVTIVGNSASRNAGSGDYNACVAGPPRLGAQVVEIDIAATTNIAVVNIDDDGTAYAEATMLIRFFYRASDGLYGIMSNNVSLYSGTTTTGLSGKMRIVYHGNVFRCYLNATQIGSDITASAYNLTLWPKWTIYNGPNIVFTGMFAGPVTDLNWTRNIDPATGRGTDARLLQTSLFTGVRSTNDVHATSADAGSNVTITIPAHDVKFAGASGTVTVSYNSGSITGKSYGTYYYVYCDDATLAGGAVSYTATTDPDVLTAAVGRRKVCEILTVNAGGGGGGGGGGGSGGGIDVPI